MSNIKTMGRNPAIMVARILGMLFIVLCHIIQYYTFVPGHGFLGQFFNCGVQLFLFVSGYLYGEKTIQGFRKWYIKRVATVAFPSVLVSVFTIIALLIVGNTITINNIIAYCLDLEGLLFINYNLQTFFQEIRSLGPLWFTTIIMLCYLLVPLLQTVMNKIEKKERFLILFFIIGTLISITVGAYVSIYYFIIYIIGYIAGNIRFLNKVNPLVFSLYSIAFVAGVAGRIVLHHFLDDSYLYQVFVSVSQFFVGTWFVVLFAFINNMNRKFANRITSSGAIALLENYSFFIYLTHGVFCMGTFNLFDKFSLPISTVLFVFFTVVAAIVIKLLSNTIQKAVFKRLSFKI